MSEIDKSLANLKAEKRNLVAQLTRIERAIDALESLVSGTTVHSSRKTYGFTCNHIDEHGKMCGKPFTAKRKDAKFCHECKRLRSSKEGRKLINKPSNKPTTLLKGDNLSAKPIK